MFRNCQNLKRAVLMRLFIYVLYACACMYHICVWEGAESSLLCLAFDMICMLLLCDIFADFGIATFCAFLRIAQIA